QLGLCDDGQRPLAADDQLVQATRQRVAVSSQGVTKDVQIVAADAPEDAREAALDLAAVGVDDVPDPGVQGGLGGAAAGALVPLLQADGAELRPAAVGEDDAQAQDVVEGLAVDDGAGAGGVVADQAAEVGPAGGGHVGAELEAVGGGGPVELVEDDARLDDGTPALAGDGQDLVEALADVEDESGAHGLA